MNHREIFLQGKYFKEVIDIVNKAQKLLSQVDDCIKEINSKCDTSSWRKGYATESNTEALRELKEEALRQIMLSLSMDYTSRLKDLIRIASRKEILTIQPTTEQIVDSLDDITIGDVDKSFIHVSEGSILDMMHGLNYLKLLIDNRPNIKKTLQGVFLELLHEEFHTWADFPKDWFCGRRGEDWRICVDARDDGYMLFASELDREKTDGEYSEEGEHYILKEEKLFDSPLEVLRHMNEKYVDIYEFEESPDYGEPNEKGSMRLVIGLVDLFSQTDNTKEK